MNSTEKRFADKAKRIIKKDRPTDIEEFDSLMAKIAKGYEPTVAERLFLDNFRAELFMAGSKLALEYVMDNIEKCTE